MAVIITYDENGGLWDHVAPPKADRWGPGTRVPAVIVSPMAKRRFIDHTQYDTTSILRFIERRFNLKPLGSRDANANDLTNAFAL
jgi:phospholipase C